MRNRNLRIIVVGSVLVVAAIAFFLGMATIASRSNEPAAMMRAVGQASGGVGAIGLAMIVIGAVRRRSTSSQ